MYVEIVSDVRYDPNSTSKTTTQLKSDITTKIQEYQNLLLMDFGSDLRKSKLIKYIDDADTSIISNQTSLRLIYRITPTKGTSTRVNFSFSNPLYRLYLIKYAENEIETVRSDIFTYYREGNFYDARLTDDGLGNLRIYYLTADSRQIILDENVGTVDYSTGELNFYINPYEYTNYINIFAKTQNDDIIVQQSKYLNIDYEKLTISVNVYRQ